MALPDLGDGFIQACLEAYNHDPNLVVTHILEDNLPPKLASLDRRTGHIWKGKQDKDDRDEAFKAQQRERLRAMQRQEEEQVRFVTQFENEYDDDYDDQVNIAHPSLRTTLC